MTEKQDTGSGCWSALGFIAFWWLVAIQLVGNHEGKACRARGGFPIGTFGRGMACLDSTALMRTP